ncbi:hypothetical protein [Nocardioides sp. W7]|uniref:hypothetical protein n=1 Tax=Nocardioides sp. W7 TaxID=2931390 RepID=UPI001FD36293|nr:hypothetical protein [Nocardioides sp. W7]
MRRLLGTAALVVVLAACGPATSPEEAEANQGLLDEVAEQVAAEDGVTDVVARYVDDAENQARAALTVECRRCDVPALLDSTVRAVWASEVTPLYGISVRVSDLERVESDYVSLSVRTDEAELGEKYGERPVPSLPEDE